MNLESLYNNLRKLGLLSKYATYDGFTNFLFETNGFGPRLGGFYRTIKSSDAASHIKSRAELFEKVIIPAFSNFSPLSKDHFLLIFNALKSEGLLKSVRIVDDLIERLETKPKRIEFFSFLHKLEYASSEDLSSACNSILDSYLTTHYKAIKSLESAASSSDWPKAIKVLEKVFPTVILTKGKTLSNTKNVIVDGYFKEYIPSFVIKLTLNDKNELLKQKTVAEAYADLFALRKSEKTELLKPITDKIESIEAEFKTINSFIESAKDKESRLKRVQPAATYCEEIESAIGDTKLGYFKEIRIGEYKFGNHIMPILFPVFDYGGAVWRTNRKNRSANAAAIQNILLRIILSLPAGHCRIRIIDEDFGSTFHTLLELPKSIIGEKVYYDDKEVLVLFEELKKRDGRVVFNKLKSSFTNLIEFNKVNEYDFEPVELVVMNNFPRHLNDQFIKYIGNSIEKKSKTGVFFFILHDDDAKNDELNQENIDFVINSLQRLDAENDRLNKILSDYDLLSGSFLFENRLKIPEYALKKISEMSSVQHPRKEADAQINKDTSESTSTASGIKINIGITDRSKPVDLDLSSQSGAYHGLICGTTGSGKTVLLHQIITGGAKKYLADELQFILLDYKEGTGFQCYKDLPHARIMSVDADIDFGLETFRFIAKTMKDRAADFKKYNTKDVEEYRKKSNRKCPRFLIIIDEFQVLTAGTNNNRESAEEIKRLLDDTVRLGRSYGIHLLLATQTPSGAKLNYGTLENISIRIGLRMSQEAERSMFNHGKPIASQFTERFGKAVYNDKSGVESESIVFNIRSLEEEKIPLFVAEAVIDAKKSKTFPDERTIYFANQYAPYTNEINYSHGNNNTSVEAYIGVAASVDQRPISIKMDNSSLSNILIIGRQSTARADLLQVLISSFTNNSDSYSKVFFYCDKPDEKDFLEQKMMSSKNLVWIKDAPSLEDTLLGIERQQLTDTVDADVHRELIVISGAGRLGDFAKRIPDPNLPFSDMKSSISRLLTIGLSRGIATIVALDDVSQINHVVGNAVDKFEFGISLSGSANKIKEDISDTYVLSENLAVLYQKSLDSETKFNLIKL